MATEIVTLRVIRYYDTSGNPTCAISFPKLEVCRFYRTQRFGTNETCLFAPYIKNGYTETLNRRRNNNGSLIPGVWCPIWKVEE